MPSNSDTLSPDTVPSSERCPHCGAPTKGRSSCPECRLKTSFSAKYPVIEKLGQGGFGVVYKCLDLDLQREVAIKELHPHYAALPSIREAFANEALAMAALNHPNIVAIYERNATGLYIVMEYVQDARTLDSVESAAPGYCRTHFLEILGGIGGALARAHSLNILHRDIKYENILMSDGHLKLADFGLAKILSASGKPISMAGTDLYIAPEVISGEPVDQRADLYSLGVLFYHMWTGAFPFDSPDRRTLLSLHLHGKPQHPRELNHNLPLALADIIMRLLAKSPADRFSSASELIHACTDAMGPGRRVGHFQEFQTKLNGMYAEINGDRSLTDILARLQVRVAGISRHASRAPSSERSRAIGEYLVKAFGWSLALASAQRLIATDAILNKYRNRCPYCQGSECVCPETGKRTSAMDLSVDVPSFKTFQDLTDMFSRVYGRRNGDLTATVHKLHIELGELTEVILKLEAGRTGEVEGLVRDETADLFAWLFAIVNLIARDNDIAEELVTYFDGACPSCKQKICRCDLNPPGFELLGKH